MPNFLDVIHNDKEIKEILDDRYPAFSAKFSEPQNKHKQIINANNKPKTIQIRQNLAKEFKELWAT